MKISLLNEQVTFQKNAATVDAIGNHRNVWTDYYTCYTYAAASGYQQKEQEAAGVTTAQDSLIFTVRYCSELSGLDTTHYRLVFRGEPYNITAVDMVNYRHKSIKITCGKIPHNGAGGVTATKAEEAVF